MTIPVFINRWSPPIIWATLIFVFSSYSTLPGPTVVWWDFLLKKSAHMIEYAIFFYLMSRAINWGKTTKRWLVPFIITIAYAMSDEYHQSFVPGRTALVTDVGYDALGAFITYLRLQRFI